MSDVLARTTDATYSLANAKTRLIDARLEYLRKHGAGWLLRNQPPPAPGYPRLRGRKVEL